MTTSAFFEIWYSVSPFPSLCALSNTSDNTSWSVNRNQEVSCPPSAETGYSQVWMNKVMLTFTFTNRESVLRTPDSVVECAIHVRMYIRSCRGRATTSEKGRRPEFVVSVRFFVTSSSRGLQNSNTYILLVTE